MVARPKWHVECRNVEVRDVVLVQDSNAVRGEWRTGIVNNTFPSADCKVGKGTILYKNFQSNEHVIDYKEAKYTTIERLIQRSIVLLPKRER